MEQCYSRQAKLYNGSAQACLCPPQYTPTAMLIYLEIFTAVLLLTMTAASQTRHAFDDSLVSGCRFTLGDREFDMCPAFLHAAGPLLANGRTYIFSLNKPVEKNADRKLQVSRSQSRNGCQAMYSLYYCQCTSNWICMIGELSFGCEVSCEMCD